MNSLLTYNTDSPHKWQGNLLQASFCLSVLKSCNGKKNDRDVRTGALLIQPTKPFGKEKKLLTNNSLCVVLTTKGSGHCTHELAWAALSHGPSYRTWQSQRTALCYKHKE